MTGPRQAIIALGSNLGQRHEHLSRALSLLARTPGIIRVIPSPVYETAPVGVTDQPPFLNMVAGLETTMSPEELMTQLLLIEQQIGRTRTIRWGPRIIDLDLLFFEREERRTPSLTLPHPRWPERSFVTVPLKDLLAHPAFDQPEWAPLRHRLLEVPHDREIKKADPVSFQ